jgi:hypothetical protein
VIFELGLVHTAMRDIAMAASWKLLRRPTFARDAPFALPVPSPLRRDTYEQAMLARHRSTRGIPVIPDSSAVARAVLDADMSGWVDDIRSRL